METKSHSIREVQTRKMASIHTVEGENRRSLQVQDSER